MLVERPGTPVRNRLRGALVYFLSVGESIEGILTRFNAVLVDVMGYKV